jgi:acyl-CoA thioester hydrolase
MPKSASHHYRVYYEDTDSGGVVYYANYLKFFERARTDFLRDKNIIQSNLAKDFSIVFVVKKCQINYIKPAKLDDLLEVTTSVSKIGGASIEMMQEIKTSSEILCTLNVKIACTSNFKPAKIPQNIQTLLKK